MPTAKTESTELAVSFGLLNIEPFGPEVSTAPIDYNQGKLNHHFEGSLLQGKYLSFSQEFRRAPGLYRQFFNLGLHLRNCYPLFNNLTHLTWSGPKQQAATTSASKDIIAANIPISVKNESNVVLNPSPYNLFVTIPSGQMPASHADNWYITADPSGISNLYRFARANSGLDLPEDYPSFEETIHRERRDDFQDAIGRFSGDVKAEFLSIYQAMCRRVAEYSAQLFNQNYASASGTNRRSALLENLVKQFFRVNSVPYILAGLDNRKPFALEIPDLTAWKQNWRLVEVSARPDLTRKQSVVNIGVTVERKELRQRFPLSFHVEIRWSHGKFCGNPEAKLYKEFDWADVPFFKEIL